MMFPNNIVSNVYFQNISRALNFSLDELSTLISQSEIEIIIRLCLIEIRHSLENEKSDYIINMLELADQYLDIFTNSAQGKGHFFYNRDAILLVVDH